MPGGPPPMKFVRGSIYWAWVPYNDAPDQTSHRPVLVLGYSDFGPGQDAVVLVVTMTRFGGGGTPRHGDIPCVVGGQESWIRARRLWGADPQAIDRRQMLGKVDEETMAKVLVEVASLFVEK